MLRGRPGAAREYLQQIADDFEKYAAATLPSAIADPRADEHQVYAALRYVVTRKAAGHQDALAERFSAPRPSRLAERINESCFEALLATSTDRATLARLFVEIGTLTRPRATTRYCADGICQLGELGLTTVIASIRAAPDGPTRLRCARLLARAADMRLPHTPKFWRSAGPDEIEAAVDAWRDQLVAGGQLAAAAPARPDAIDSNGGATVKVQDGGND